jgi:uncharacterized damage-inducible protein DinB
VKRHKEVAVIFVMCSLICTVSFAQSSSQSSSASPTIASVLDRQLSSIEQEIMGSAEAVPADKFDFSPATANIPGDFKTPKPVRTLSEQLKHIGDALEAYSDLIMGEKPPQSNDENGPSTVKTKSDVMNYLKTEFAKAHSAINTINQQNVVEPIGPNQRTRLALAVAIVAHSNNHYGQIIEYLRMNGMVPVESQPQPKK